jgi:hypothetical protein
MCAMIETGSAQFFLFVLVCPCDRLPPPRFSIKTQALHNEGRLLQALVLSVMGRVWLQLLRLYTRIWPSFLTSLSPELRRLSAQICRHDVPVRRLRLFRTSLRQRHFAVRAPAAPGHVRSNAAFSLVNCSAFVAEFLGRPSSRFLQPPRSKSPSTTLPASAALCTDHFHSAPRLLALTTRILLAVSSTSTAQAMHPVLPTAL